MYRSRLLMRKVIITARRIVMQTDAVYQKIMDQDSGFEVWQSVKQQFEASSKDQLFMISTVFFEFEWLGCIDSNCIFEKFVERA